MILVIDANVIVSALIFGGKPDKLIVEAYEKGDVLATCAEILAEVGDVLQRKHIINVAAKAGLSPPLILPYVKMASIYSAVPIPPTVRDPDDDVILGCAVAAKADMIVTGDKDLLDLEAYESIPILTVAEALRRMTRA